MLTLNTAYNLDETRTDGPGVRTSLYVSGCSVRCAGCQNDHLFDGSFGTPRPVAEVADDLLARGRPITILGGEPLDQPVQVAALVTRLKADPRLKGPLIVYTGYIYEKLFDRWLLRIHTDEAMISESTLAALSLRAILHHADILVDGPYMPRKDDDFVQFRGSRNQRPINLAAMREAGDMRTPILCDWDKPRIRVRADGVIEAAAGVIDLIAADLGVEGEEGRRCGQTRP